MKYILVLYMCSMVTNQCPNSSIPGYTFNSHIDCVEMGYRAAYNTFKALEKTEELDKEYIENNRIVIKFECRAVPNTNKKGNPA